MTDEHWYLMRCSCFFFFCLKVTHYKFSISWSRVLPTGSINEKNAKGLQYYKSLVAELLKNNIQPVASLYHFDLPEALQAKGGWLNNTTVDHFEAYARYMFKELGDSVCKYSKVPL